MVGTIQFGSRAVALLGAGGAFGVLFAVVLAVRYAASFPVLPAPGPQTSDLGEEPPAVANLLVNRCAVTRTAAAATLVDLAARQHLELFEAGPSRFVVRVRPEHDEPLTAYERQVLDLVRAKATGGSAPLEVIRLDPGAETSWNSRLDKEVVRDAKSRGLLRGRWSQLDWGLFGVLAALAVFLIAAGLYTAHVELTGHASSSNGARFPREDWFWIAAVAWSAILAFIASLRSVRYSASGKAAAARWLGVKHFLRQDPSFGDAPPAAVAIWGRLLAYGTALGAARSTAAAIPLDAENRDTAWSRAGGDWHQVHIEYPRHFGYGGQPRRVLLGGLVRAVFWGALAFAVLPAVANGLWGVGSDAIHGTTVSNAATIGLVGVFFVAIAALGLVLLVRFADGLIRVWHGGADLGHVDTVTGPVVKVIADGLWFAVDPGSADHVRAWHPGAATLPVCGATVRVSVTRHLGSVSALTVLSSPAVSSPATGSGVPEAATSGTAPDHAALTLDVAAVRDCTGLNLREVDPSSLSGLGQHIPPGAAVRAFSDGANHVLIGTTPPARAPSSTATSRAARPGGLPQAGGRERWIAGQLLVQLGPAGLIAVEVDLRDQSSGQRQQIARALASRVASISTTTGPGAAPPTT